MHGRKKLTAIKELTQTIKHTGVLNHHETQRLGSCVDKFQKEFEKKLKELSVQQSQLIASQRLRDSRRGSLPSSPSIKRGEEEEQKKDVIKNSFSDSALDQCAMVGNGNATLKDPRSGSNTGNNTLSSLPLKLPRIYRNSHKDGSREIQIEDIKSTKKSVENVFDKLKYSRQALDMTRKLSNGYSAMITASPPIMRSTRRASVQAASTLVVEEHVPNRRTLIRRGSCPTLGTKWRMEARTNELGLETNEEEKTAALSRHLEEMKKCRYLRFPKSIKEDDEEELESLVTDV